MAAKIWTVCALRLDFVRMLRVEHVRVSVFVCVWEEVLGGYQQEGNGEP